MKRCLFLVLVLLLCLSLFACGKEQTTQVPEPDTNVITCYPAPEDVTPPAQESVPPPEEPVPADPLPGEQVAPEIPEVVLYTSSTQYTDTDNVTVVQLETLLPSCHTLPQIHDFYQNLISDFLGIASLNREDAARQRADYQAMGQEFSPWQVNVSAEVTRNDGVTLSIMREIREQLGGDPTITYQCETFDVASQGRLLLGDLFQPGADYLTRLVDSSEVDQLNFALSDDNLILCIEGGYRTLPLSDLSDILLPQYITE